ncbi:MAG: DNA polymerase III subunit delta' [Dehalococcoidales bacterium]|nr:DNA polymerase III subunit delta' [Dehalococcoidales bacterium]
MWQVVERSRSVPLLKSSLERGRLPNAYLLVGPAHVGKMTLALTLAQALNCEASEPPCGECNVCRKIAAGKHADVQVIGLSPGNGKEAKTKTEISIDQVRAIQHDASLPPFEGKYKVFIVDGAERLSNEAANCLLKTLEEPADKIIYILLTTNEQLLPLTVISRCQKLELLPIAPEKMDTVLQERWQIESPKAKLLSRLSHGCLGWAVTTAQNDSLLDERKAKLENIIGVLNAGITERFAYADQMANRFSKDRHSVSDELELWLDWWRDLMLVKVGSDDRITNIDYAKEISRIAEDYTLSEIRLFIKKLQEAMTQLDKNASPRLVLEVLMFNIPGRK